LYVFCCRSRKRIFYRNEIVPCFS